MLNVVVVGFCLFILVLLFLFFGFDSWEEFIKLRDFEKVFELFEYIKWCLFRDSDDLCFVLFMMLRFLFCLFYGVVFKFVEEFNYEEFEVDEFVGCFVSIDNGDYCWSNVVYVMVMNMIKVFF